MKYKLLAVLLSVCFLVGVAIADPGYPGKVEPVPSHEKSICPVTLYDDSCSSCHTMRVRDDGTPYFGLKEVEEDSWRRYPNSDTKIIDGKGYFYQDVISDAIFAESMRYFVWKGIKHVVIEINNPGGGLFDTWRMVGLMRHYEANYGMVFETRCYGMSMSAGFLMLVGGTKGHRFVSPQATLMWHELWSIAWLKLETPSSNEDEALIMRNLQNTVHQWMVERSNITKDELDAKVKRKEWWMNGTEAVELGFADGFTEAK